MERDEAVREALQRFPCSERALARTAGISRSTLSKIRLGERGVSSAIVKRIADALATWGEDCAEAERILRETLNEEER